MRCMACQLFEAYALLEHRALRETPEEAVSGGHTAKQGPAAELDVSSSWDLAVACCQIASQWHRRCCS